MRAGGAGATGATEYLPTKLANNERRKKIKTKKKLSCVGKVRIRFDFHDTAR
jgi:hypothetical protein